MRALLFDNGGNLRSGWRAFIFIMVFVLLAGIFSVVGLKIGEALNLDPAVPIVRVGVNASISLVAALISAWLCIRFVEGIPFRSLGTMLIQNWHAHLGLGLLLGTATLGLTVFIAYAAGSLTFGFNSTATRGEIAVSLAISLLLFGIAAGFEEVLFRGYVLQTFSRSGLGWLAIALTSVFFGIVHMGNPSAGLISTINTMLAGIWFGLAYLRTRDLWFVWGLHLMWNWIQGSVFGIEVSGITNVTTSPLLLEVDRGPAWLTGESYGIEGGIACTLAIIISILIIYKIPGLDPDPELLKLTSTPKAVQPITLPGS